MINRTVHANYLADMILFWNIEEPFFFATVTAGIELLAG
jgi:hypothetical protein